VGEKKRRSGNKTETEVLRVVAGRRLNYQFNLFNKQGQQINKYK